MRIPPAFYVTDSAAIRKFFESDGSRFFFLEGLGRNFTFLDNFRKEDILFIQSAWFSPKAYFRMELDVALQFSNISIENIYFLCNSEFEHQEAVSASAKAILCNHNCWLDYSLFSASDDVSLKAYDLIMNTRPELWKRPYLARKVNSVCILKGYNFRKDEYFELNSLKPVYINDERLNPTEVATKLTQAYVGCSFSEVEGACYSSSEMLLSGLPVVSTKSIGGRDFWYTDNNSLIVSPNEDDVCEAVSVFKNKIINGHLKPSEIRAEHVALSDKTRGFFMSTLNQICVEKSLSTDNLDINRLFKHKMVDYVIPSNLNIVFG